MAQILFAWCIFCVRFRLRSREKLLWSLFSLPFSRNMVSFLVFLGLLGGLTLHLVYIKCYLTITITIIYALMIFVKLELKNLFSARQDLNKIHSVTQIFVFSYVLCVYLQGFLIPYTIQLESRLTCMTSSSLHFLNTAENCTLLQYMKLTQEYRFLKTYFLWLNTFILLRLTLVEYF